jgi:signal transduction histidine kinase
VWTNAPANNELLMTRRVEGAGTAWHETYRLDWDQLAETLLGEVRDLFPGAQLVPILADEGAATVDDRAMRLATIPARFVAPAPAADDRLASGHVWLLAGAWSALLFALVVGGLALQSSYAYADKHRRFTHAVTHELRTPLTTFRLYSEMLARGMVPETSRAEYLTTLESESERLSRLVENVLRYAHLEDRKAGPPLADTSVAQVLERCVPELTRSCATLGARLEVADFLDGEVALRTDADAVLQILSNLVENASKYGRAAASEPGTTPIQLRVRREGSLVHFDVVDDGPGVPAAVARSIFEPFDRGGRDPSDRAPGVGLGLALARALAHELGGSLTLVSAPRGATFRLSLPV